MLGGGGQEDEDIIIIIIIINISRYIANFWANQPNNRCIKCKKKLKAKQAKQHRTLHKIVGCKTNFIVQSYILIKYASSWGSRQLLCLHENIGTVQGLVNKILGSRAKTTKGFLSRKNMIIITKKRCLVVCMKVLFPRIFR